MPNKNVLVISYVFPPMAGGGVFRTLKFVKHLPRYGWQPVVLTIRPYPRHEYDETLLEEVPPDVEVVRCLSLEFRRAPKALYRLFGNPDLDGGHGTEAQTSEPARATPFNPPLKSRIGTFLRDCLLVPDHTIGWLPFALRAARRIISQRKIDVVYSSFPPGTAHLIAYLLKQRYHIPWVADFRDPWTDHPRYRAGRVARHHRSINKALERRTLMHADRVITATEPWAEDFLREYPQLHRSKVVTVTNGFDEEDFVNLGAGGDSVSENPGFTLVYAGLMGGLHLGALFAAWKALIQSRPQETINWRMRFIGKPNPQLGLEIRSMGLEERVEFTGYLPHLECLSQMCRASVLVVYGWGDQFHTGKIFEYLRAGRPILALARPESAMGQLMTRSGTGIAVPPEDREGILQALCRLSGLSDEGAFEYSGDSDFIGQFDRAALTRSLALVFDSAAGFEPRNTSSGTGARAG